MIDFNEPL